MSTKKEEKEDILVDVQHAYSKTELYIEENKKSLTIIVAAILIIIGGYFAWDRLYVVPMEEEAQAKMFVAQQYFEKDSFDLAIKGDGNNLGFEAIVNEYGVTKASNLAHYYLGISYLRKGQFEKAIEELNNFDTDSDMLGPIALGAIGDAQLELGKEDEAVAQYLKAAKISENKFSTPIFLMKAAGIYEDKKNFENALKIYQQIKTDYPQSAEGRDIDKYITRAQAFMNK